GSAVDWRRYDQPYGRAKTALPTYPFQRQRFWHNPRPAEEINGATMDLEALASTAVANGSLSKSERAALPALGQALKAAQVATHRRASASAKDILSTGLYEVAWREAPTSAPDAVTPKIRHGCWVLFVDGHGVGHALRAAIAARGGTVIEVRAGQRY